MSRRQPTRRDLRSVVLWAARMLASEDGGATLYSESIRVKIEKVDEGESFTVKPRKGADGLTCPEQLRPVGEVEVTVSELLRAAFSDAERVLLKDLLAHEPCKASEVMQRCKSEVRESVFWTVWGGLQSRGVVVQGDDDLYRVGPSWVAELLEGKKGNAKKPAA